jgi:hypothetical protein
VLSSLTTGVLGDGNIDGTQLADAREVATVAIHGAIILRTLLGVAIEEHIIRQQLPSQNSDLLGSREVGTLVEDDGVHISIGSQLHKGCSQRRGLLLGDQGNVSSLGGRHELRHEELEVTAHLRPATEAQRALDLGERLSILFLAFTTQVDGGADPATIIRLDSRAHQLRVI